MRARAGAQRTCQHRLLWPGTWQLALDQAKLLSHLPVQPGVRQGMVVAAGQLCVFPGVPVGQRHLWHHGRPPRPQDHAARVNMRGHRVHDHGGLRAQLLGLLCGAPADGRGRSGAGAGDLPDRHRVHRPHLARRGGRGHPDVLRAGGVPAGAGGPHLQALARHLLRHRGHQRCLLCHLRHHPRVSALAAGQGARGRGQPGHGAHRAREWDAHAAGARGTRRKW
mmetsp:Transcript_22222/g.56465  ORF Transcript_22222/g.56465 Transcript_22222/m.56465 type:complete len:223 (-) Transcript_22222:502-1170(-)